MSVRINFPVNVTAAHGIPHSLRGTELEGRFPLMGWAPMTLWHRPCCYSPYESLSLSLPLTRPLAMWLLP